MTIFLALCAGLGLSAACGLRVFLPLFVAAVAVRAGGLAVGSQFDWLGSNAAIVVFGTATAVEIVGFLIPWVDHVLDLLAAPLAAIAGSVLMCSQLLTLSVTSVDGTAVEPLLNPAVAWSLGIIVGAATASGVEAASIAGRLSSSVLTIGWRDRAGVHRDARRHLDSRHRWRHCPAHAAGGALRDLAHLRLAQQAAPCARGQAAARA
jgi:hypothetical protein